MSDTTEYFGAGEVSAPPSDAGEYPVPFAEFARAIQGTDDEVYTKLVRLRAGVAARTPSAWRALLVTVQAQG